MRKIIQTLKGWLINSFRKKKRVYNPCQLIYIPNRLRTNDREPVQIFTVGELLFRRCNPSDLSNPYNSISLTELSHNRQLGGKAIPSEAGDVLFNIDVTKPFERYVDKEVCTIRILDLNENSQYDKTFVEGADSARMKLIHDPAPCMYPHSVFRIFFNGEIVTYDNYKHNIKKANKIRNQLKTELASMIVTETLSQQA